jgi:hypothetical protein
MPPSAQLKLPWGWGLITGDDERKAPFVPNFVSGALRSLQTQAFEETTGVQL